LASLRVSVSPIVGIEPLEAKLAERVREGLEQLSRGAADGRTATRVRRTHLLSTGWDPAALAQCRTLQRDIYECRGGKSPVLTTVAIAPTTQRVLPRGNWQDESGEVVLPATPAFLTHGQDPGRRLTRLDLAKWIVSADNPLTSRAMTNRLWKQFFGNAISVNVEDLGAQGEWPSHPELLDWLAVEFRDGDGRCGGWDVKHVVRLIVTSSAYRQSSNLRPELHDVDPGNRLLASQNPRRLEAEFVRDNALFIAGLLNEDLGGPSCFPYQPPGYYANIQFPDRKWVSDTDEQQYRRGLYMHWQRTFLHPMLANFDAPSREDAVCTRNVSNTPQQALTLLNDPTFVEAARVLAQAVSCGCGDDDDALGAIYQKTLARDPRDNETASLKAFLERQRTYYKAHPDEAKKLVHIGDAPVVADADDADLAAWTSVCRVVLNLHETITRY
jgi:hypothetical protein